MYALIEETYLLKNLVNIKKYITCGYHGKQFDTCGKFKFMPKTEGMQNFPSAQDDLPEIAVAKWRQFIFSSLALILILKN